MLSTVWPKSHAMHCKVPLTDGVYSQVARNLSHVARNFSYEKKSQVARRNKYQKDLSFRLLIGNNVEKFLSLKRSLFVITP